MVPEIPAQLNNPGKPALEEIAASGDGRDVTVPFMGALREVQDTVLRRLGNNYEAYREIRRDDQVHATFQQRRLALTSRPLIIEPGADDARSIAAADQLRRNLEAIPFDRTGDKMSWGQFYGYAVAECMWEVRDGLVWLARPKVRTPWRFRFDKDGRLRLLTLSNLSEGELMPDRKFWVMSWGADNDDDPYGLGLAHQLYWPVYFKKQGLGFWLRALEKFGAPSTVVKYPAGSGRDVTEQALSVARRLRLDGAAAIPDTMVMELLEATRGTVDQATFHRQMQAAIAKIILGQTMTTDDGSSLAQGQVHMEVREELTDADAEIQCESFQNGPARWLTEWNFPGAAVPIVKRPSPEDEAATAELLAKKAAALKAMRDAGLEPDDETRLAITGPGWRPVKAPAAPEAPAAVATPPVPPAGPQFAEVSGEEPDAIDDFTDAMDWEPVMTRLRDQVVAFVEAQPDLQTAADQLGALLAGDGAGQLQEMVARALFEARLAGAGGLMLSAAQEREQAQALQ
jgi:phage gp29-like protein